jgi:predicted GTPase
MKEFAVLGRPNSGKTMFALNFAAYLNCKSIDITFRSYDGMLNCRHVTIAEAKKDLCSPQPHKTRSIQSMVLKLPLGKTPINFKLSDTCGISEEIHGDEAIRRGMAQSLSLLTYADYIIHIVDLAVVNERFLTTEANIDREIYQFGISRKSYLMLANKIDLPFGKESLSKLSTEFNQTAVVPISAYYGHGFQEVKTYVARNL